MPLFDVCPTTSVMPAFLRASKLSGMPISYRWIKRLHQERADCADGLGTISGLISSEYMSIWALPLCALVGLQCGRHNRDSHGQQQSE
jgi:hypothetical protein